LLEPAPSLFHSAPYTDPRQVLETLFGYPEFRPGQRAVIDAVLSGRDALVVMPTGAGKSLTFQIPAKLLKGPVLVVSPLISLMKDQVDALVRLGFRATVLNSTIDFDERRRRLAALREGKIELLYVAPEGLEGSLRGLIAACHPSLVAVDEAHCISHWGHDFRPAYRKLSGLKQELHDVPILALTATATRRVASDVRTELGMRDPIEYRGSFFRPNLIVTGRKKGALASGARSDTRREMLGIIRRHPGASGIVYCLSRRGVESTTGWLRAQGIRASSYHAGLADAERERNQNAFARGAIDVIVATVAFGMGIDKPDVRYVIHRDMPRSIEAWYQEIGRAGRDGKPSDCVAFFSWADVMGYEGFLNEVEDPTLREETRRRTIELFRLLDRNACRHQAVVRHFDERIEPCGTSCDVCLGVGIEAIAGVPRSGAGVRGQAMGKALTGGAGVGRRMAMGETLGTRRSQDGGGASRVAKRRQEPTQSGSRPWPSGAPLPPPIKRVPDTMTNPELFERLRTVRRRLADAESVPAFVVFSDAVLWRMASLTPQTRADMLAISGIGAVKMERYGAAFLEVLTQEKPSE